MYSVCVRTPQLLEASGLKEVRQLQPQLPHELVHLEVEREAGRSYIGNRASYGQRSFANVSQYSSIPYAACSQCQCPVFMFVWYIVNSQSKHATLLHAPCPAAGQ